MKLINGNLFDELPEIESRSFDLVISDPPYSKHNLIDFVVYNGRRISRGATLVFMYAEDLWHLTQPPDQVLFWVKPISTKNTAKRYSRFVEVIAVYDIDTGPFNQELYWSNKSGIFTDALINKPRHPFEKPVSLLQRLIENHSNRDNNILDICSGSGTTMEAAMLCGRDCTGIEIDEGNCNIIRERLGNGICN